MAVTKLGFDIGASNTKICASSGDVVLDEPTVIAVANGNIRTEIKAVGMTAKKLIGKTAENTKIIFPVFEGEVVNEKLTALMVKRFLNQIKFRQGFSTSQAVVAVPCGADILIIKKLKKVFTDNSLSNVSFVEAPLLSAIGQNIPLTESSPCFIIDMGGGNTNIAALSLDGIIAGVSVSIGGKNIDTSLIDFIADNYGLQIGLLTAERIKIQIGSLLEHDTLSTVVNGRDLENGRPRSIVLKAEDIIVPVKKYYDKIFEIASSVLSKLPPEVSAEIRHSGIYVSGGSALTVGLESYYQKKFNMNINIPMEPRMSVISGAGVLLSNHELIKKLKISVV